MLATKPAQVTERLYFKQKPTVEEVRGLVTLLPGGAKDLLSIRSRRYKELALGEKDLSEEEVISLLAAEPGLWRRPVVVRGDRAVIGYNAANLEALLS